MTTFNHGGFIPVHGTPTVADPAEFRRMEAVRAADLHPDRTDQATAPSVKPPTQETPDMARTSPDPVLTATRTGRELGALVRRSRTQGIGAIMDEIDQIDEIALRALLATAIVVLDINDVYDSDPTAGMSDA